MDVLLVSLMDWTSPIALTLPPTTTPFQRVVAMLGHYDIRFYCTPKAYVDVGAGSLPCVVNLSHIQAADEGRLGSIGRYCEFHPTARVIVRGAHKDQPVNVTFTGFPLMGGAPANDALEELRPFSIGSGVIISANAIVLDGRTIGDATVIGAGTVVSRDCEPYGIYAGAPNKRIRSREPFEPWWNLPSHYLLQNRDRLSEIGLSQDIAPRVARPAFCLANNGNGITVLGFVDDDQIRPLQSAPKAVMDYVSQAFSAQQPYWLADCWA